MDYYRAAEIFGLGSSIWKFWGTVSATMSFIVVLVNTLLLHTFIKNPLLRNRKHMMVVNLAVADLIYGLLGIPSLIFSIFNPTPISIIVSTSCAVCDSYNYIYLLFTHLDNSSTQRTVQNRHSSQTRQIIGPNSIAGHGSFLGYVGNSHDL
ncbi:hypothetical protein pdam_00011682 [Pocillopora damicornis]|uniref:G-protein coupled receptors family 1 profile domain-containing protein n=1 Tax=Pocillopora damicornis TaxID=46731 RepID=A0A3M6UR94_POCDA|nr:hypothetical protein pdam_00011682 [Pocillopora damicornis]